MPAHRSVTALVTVALACAAARADADGEPDFEAAREHYRAAQAAAGDARWDEAASEYAAAFELTGDPVIHFRIADAYEHAGDCERALEHYQRYIEDASPPEAYAELALRRVNACQDVLLAARETEPEPPDEASPDQASTNEPDPQSDAPIREEPSAGAQRSGEEHPADGAPVEMQRETWHRGAAWTSTGMAVVFAATSGILAASASAREDDLERLMSTRNPETGEPITYSGHTRERYDSLVREGQNLALASRIALGAAGAATAAAVTFFLLDPGPGGRVPALTPLSPNRGVGIAAGWEF